MGGGEQVAVARQVERAYKKRGREAPNQAAAGLWGLGPLRVHYGSAMGPARVQCWSTADPLRCCPFPAGCLQGRSYQRCGD